MISNSKETSSSESEFSTFYIGEMLCGLEIIKIQEINRQHQVTKVPHTEPYIEGIINLRGKIVTLINVGRKLGIRQSESDRDSRIIITKIQGEYIGLMVDAIGDVVIADPSRIEPVPSNIEGAKSRYFKSVIKLNEQLIGVLDVDTIAA